MKKLLLILLCLPMIGFGQLTMIPDANFEQKLINLGYDNGAINGSVYTALIDTVTILDVSVSSISDLTGIEAFTALTSLECHHNQLTSLNLSQNTDLTLLNCSINGLTTLDVSQNTALTYLDCSINGFTSLDVSNNTDLWMLYCSSNNLTSLDVSTNTSLTGLDCSYNLLPSLDVSQNTNLTSFGCWNNQLTSLDLRNGNNTNITSFWVGNNPNLTCINVDDFQYSLFNWINIDPQHYFSNNCTPTAIEEHSTNKELLKTTDLLGRETKQTNQPLFYIYDDGTVEKRIVIE
jgi:hypothetical protein